MSRRILILMGYYLPGYRAGGILRSVANLVEWIGDEARFWVITRGHDLGQATPYPDIELNAWNLTGKATVFYLEPGKFPLKQIRRSIQEAQPDIVYLCGFFSPFTIRYLFMRKLRMIPRVPILLAPHGEFSPGALIVKAPKKRLYIKFAHGLLRMYRGVTFLASTPQEHADIRRALGIKPEIQEFSLLPPKNTAPAPRIRRTKTPGSMNLVFCSRVSEKKNLHWLLPLLAEVEGEIILDVLGPLAEARYANRCKALAAKLPSRIKVIFHGEVEHSEVMERVGCADFFILPTLGENFGYAIAEALLAGTPAVISDTTPWLDLEESNAGWSLPLTEQLWISTLKRCMSMDNQELSRMRLCAAEYSMGFFQNPSVGQNRSLFLGAKTVSAS